MFTGTRVTPEGDGLNKKVRSGGTVVLVQDFLDAILGRVIALHSRQHRPSEIIAVPVHLTNGAGTFVRAVETSSCLDGLAVFLVCIKKGTYHLSSLATAACL